jgi:hypothetical protein
LALLGGIIPGAATVLYFTATGAFGALFEGAFLLPVTGTQRGDATLLGHLAHVVSTVRTGYGIGQLVFWPGIGALLALMVARAWRLRREGAALARDPLLLVILPPLVFVTAFSVVDFQGYPDLYPFLPYAALGVAGMVAAVLARLEHRVPAATPEAATGGTVTGNVIAGRAIIGVALVALVATTWVWYSVEGSSDTRLLDQRAAVARVERRIGSDGTLYALGDPTPLVLSGRTNPSREIYLAAGVDNWVVNHTDGGFEGWMGRVVASDPDVILVGGWGGELASEAKAWLRSLYTVRVVAIWKAFTPRAGP